MSFTGTVAIIVVTEDAQVIEHLAMHAQENGRMAVQLDHEIASLWLATLSLSLEAPHYDDSSQDGSARASNGSWASPYFRIATSRLRRSKDLLYFGNARSAAKHSAGAMRTLAAVQARIQSAR